MYSIATNSFPRLLYPGLGGELAYQTLLLCSTTHLANVLKDAARRAADPTQLVIEHTKEAENAWTNKVEKHALWYSVVVACMTGYFNHEGATMRLGAVDPEKRRLAMRRVLHGGWRHGHVRALFSEYDAKGDVVGFDIS